MRQTDSEKHMLITGGTGFFGKSILRYLYQLDDIGTKITVLSRDPGVFESSHPELFKKVGWLEGDIVDLNSLPRDRTFSSILHAAAESTRGLELRPIERFSQIICGTENVLRLAVEVGANRFLYVSSGGVYGHVGSHIEKVSEVYSGPLDTLDSKNTYSLAKRTGEHLCHIFGEEYDLDVVTARCFSFLGPDLPMNVHFAAGNFMRDAIKGEKIVVHGNGKALRSYLDQEDLARCLLMLLDFGSPSKAYNVGSDQPISIADLAVMIRDIVAPEKEVVIQDLAPASSTRSFYVPDVSRIRHDLGFLPRYELRDAIIRMATALKRVS